MRSERESVESAPVPFSVGPTPNSTPLAGDMRTDEVRDRLARPNGGESSSSSLRGPAHRAVRLSDGSE